MVDSVNFNLPNLNKLLYFFGIRPRLNEFGVNFYYDSFPKIIITLTILIFSPLLINLIDMCKMFLKRFYD
jgi:hypothetical protein